MASKYVGSILTTLGVLTSRPIAFYFVVLYGVAWFVFDRSTLNWAGFATLATWIMTLIIQRAEHRDTQAIHAKLDDLLLSQDKARSELSQIDQLQPEEIERARAEAHSGAGLPRQP
jgi:low affinity Fe/Cu permease